MNFSKRKYLIIIILFFSCFSSYSQSQTLNGIVIDAPKGFKKTGDYKWQQNDDIIIVMSLEGELPKENHLEVLKSVQEKTKNTSFIKNESFNFSGKDYYCTYHIGDNGLLIIATLVVRKGFSYIILCGVNPGQFLDNEKEMTNKTMEQVQFLRSYMITRVLIG